MIRKVLLCDYMQIQHSLSKDILQSLSNRIIFEFLLNLFSDFFAFFRIFVLSKKSHSSDSRVLSAESSLCIPLFILCVSF